MSSALTVMRAYSGALFLLLWIVVGWNDFKHQKIRGHFLVYGACGVVAGYAILLAMTMMGHWGLIRVFPVWDYYQAALANLFLCGTAAMGLWWFGVWPAGDAKLFILLAALYPLGNFSSGIDYRRLFLVALINTFIPACAMVFIRAGSYTLSTRLIHRRHFLVQLGWKKELGFFIQSLSEAVSRLWSCRLEGATLLQTVAANPGVLILKAVVWLSNMLAMSVLSYYLKSFFSSPVICTLFWGTLLLLWRRITASFGLSISRAAMPILGILLLLLKPPTHWPELWHVFGSLTFFSVFLYLGLKWTVSLLSGSVGAAYIAAVLVPISGMLLGVAASWFGAGLSHLSYEFLVVSGMGLFFGLSLVLVRLWDKDVLPSHLSEISSYVVLAPAFIERLRRDQDFFEEHFSRLYADGLTRGQADALREWCVREGVETIPLTPTISFASWIFLGFFLAFALNGAHVLQVLF